jgi:hypothetical protein
MLILSRANAIRQLLRGELDATQAATEFTSYINSETKRKNAEGGLWRLWGLLSNVAGQLAEDEWQNKVSSMSPYGRSQRLEEANDL